jgi:hypothetical protein
MKIHFSDTPPDFIKYISFVAKKRGLSYYFRNHGSIVIKGNGKAIELCCEGTKVSFYYFDNFPNDLSKSGPWAVTNEETFEVEPSYCDEVDLTNPASIDCIMEWVNKVYK